MERLERVVASQSRTAWYFVIGLPLALMALLMVVKIWWGVMSEEPLTPEHEKERARFACEEGARRRFESCSREVFTMQGTCNKVLDKEIELCRR